MPRALITGVSGYVGAALVPRLRREGFELRGFARDARRVHVDVPVVEGDATTGAGLAEAMDDVDVAYYLIHSMEAASGNGFADLEKRSAERFAEAARAAGVPRVVYLGGPVPAGTPSAHLASRVAVERVVLEAAPLAVAFRASIVIGASSRSFRFLVRLVERLPLLGLPAWRDFRTQPVDERDVFAFLTDAAASDAVTPELSLDIAGPDVLSYGQMMERIRDSMLLGRPRIDLPITMTPIASRVAAKIAGEDVGLVGPLMESLNGDLLPRDMRAATLFDVRLHRFDAAVEHALGAWERDEELAGH